jgi:predicted nucleic acid-binding protein
VLILQSLSELFYVVTRKTMISPHIIFDRISELMELFPTVTAKPNTLKQAIKMVADYSK